MNVIKHLWPIVVSALVLTALITLVDLTDLLNKLVSIEFEVLAAVLAIHILQVFIVAVRWRLVLGGISARVPYAFVICYQFMAQSADLFMPASIGSGTVQAVLASNHIPVSKAVNSAIIDRYMAGVSYMIVTLCTAPFATFILADFSKTNAVLVAGSLLLAVILSLAILAVLARTRFLIVAPIRKFLNDFQMIGLRAGRMASLFLTSVGGLLLYITAFFILARAQGVDIEFVNLVILMPPAMLVAALPVSYGGWGVREVALAAALALVGVPLVDTIALSVQQGVVAMVPGVLGGALWAGRSIPKAKRLASSMHANSLRASPKPPATSLNGD